MKIKYKLPIFTVLIAIIPILLVSIISYNTLNKFSEENYTRIILNQSQASLKHIQDFYTTQIGIAQYSAGLEETTNFLEDYESQSSQLPEIVKQVSLSQKVAVETNPYLNSSSILNKKGIVISSSDTSLIGTDYSHSSIFQNIIKTGKLQSDVIHDNENSKDILLGVPIINKSGNVIGILQRIININYLNNYIKDLEIGDTGYLYIIDQHGDTLSHYYSNRVNLKKTDIQDMKELLNVIEQSVNGTLPLDKGFFEYTIDDIKIKAYYVVEPNTNWLIIVAVPHDEVHAAAKEATNYLAFVTIIATLIAGIIGLLISRSIIIPLTKFKNKIEIIATGKFDERCTYNRRDEFGELAQNINLMAENLDANEKTLLSLALDDELTRMANRKSIYLTMNTHFDKTSNEAVILLDLDGFKNVNDTLGHDFGDKVLIEVANILKHLSTDQVYPARLGGDEFMAFISYYENQEEVTTLASTILEKINSIKEIHSKPISISASIGIAFKENETTYNQLIKKADEAMYQVKEAGKSGIKIYKENQEE